jgi:2-aminoadipate transaminase
LSPGLRVGYAIAPAAVISKLTVCKQVSDVHTNVFAQIIADEYMGNYDFRGHLHKIREIYRKKCTLMMELLDKHLAPKITYQKVEGGLFIWCKLPEHVDMMDYCKRAVQKNVAIVPGNAFLIDEAEPCSYFRVNFSTPTDEQMVKGMEILSGLEI